LAASPRCSCDADPFIEIEQPLVGELVRPDRQREFDDALGFEGNIRPDSGFLTHARMLDIDPHAERPALAQRLAVHHAR
jgi:hypothetical protein